MDLALNINGNSSGGAQALTDLVAPAQDSAKAIEEAFASMAKKTDAAFRQMEKERVSEAKKSAEAIEAAEKKSAEAIVAANKKISDAHHEQLVQQQADFLEHREKTKAMWAEIGQAAMVAGAAFIALGGSALHAFQEAERIQKQLIRASGEYAEALSQQADAMEERLNIDAEVIKQSQILLAQQLGVGAATQDVTSAILDYAAATGKDAVTATEDLIRNVESGGVGLAKMGIHFEATGNKGEDLKRIVAALGKKFGGAAAADADSLHGQVEGTRIAFGNMMEDFGQLIAAFASKTGIIEKVRDAMKSWRDILNGGSEDQKRNEAYLAMQEKIAKALDDRAGWLQTITNKTREGDLAGAERAQQRLAALDAEIAKLKQLRDAANAAHGKGLPGLETVTGETNDAMKERLAAAATAAKKAELEREKSLTIAHAEFNAEYARKYQEQQTKGQDAAAQESVEIEKRRVAALKEEGEGLLAMQKEQQEREKEMRDDADKAAEVSIQKSIQLAQHKADEARKLLEKQEQAWAEAGAAIGSAFVTSLGRELERLMEGGDVDAGEMVANVIGDVLAVAGQVIGTTIGSIYGGVGGAQLGGAIGGAAGGLLGTGVKALGKAGRKKKYHSGGPIGDEVDIPRFHSGGALAPDEMHIIAQKGEHMLSRQQVAKLGGHAGVEQAANGGARFHFTINTIDALGTRQFFENDGGRGFFNALRTGRGSLLPAFGGG